MNDKFDNVENFQFRPTRGERIRQAWKRGLVRARMFIGLTIGVVVGSMAEEWGLWTFLWCPVYLWAEYKLNQLNYPP